MAKRKWKIADFMQHVGQVSDYGRYGMTVVRETETEVEVKLSTALNDYLIFAHEKTKKHTGSLAALAVNRASKRGNDLTDGPMELLTWYKLCQDILWFELATAQLASATPSKPPDPSVFYTNGD